MNDLAAEFFWDGVARIPPGLLIIVLYWRTEAENVFQAHRDFFSSPLLFIACIIAVAWFLGLMVEAIIFTPTALVLRYLGQLDKLFPRGETTSSDNLENSDSTLAREKRRQGYFACSQIIMSRCLSVIFFFALCDRPEPFSNVHWKTYYSLIGCLAFTSLWCLLKGFVMRKSIKAPGSSKTHV